MSAELCHTIQIAISILAAVIMASVGVVVWCHERQVIPGCRLLHGFRHLPWYARPYAASASVSFSAPAVIFEDAYTNRPGEVVERRSTTTILTCTAHGGSEGTVASFWLNNAGKIIRTSGGDLPLTQFVPSGQKLEFEVEYEGCQPSQSANDIVAYTSISGSSQESSSELTSVKVQLTAVYEAPDNSCRNRHELGIGELMYCYLTPSLGAISVQLVDANVTGGGGSRIISWGVAVTNHEMNVGYGSVAYSPSLNILQPSGIEGVNPSAITYGIPSGQAGGVKLVQGYKVLPTSVSFSRIKIEEVPCDDELPATGYFAFMPTNVVPRVHNISAGAGNWLNVGDGNIMLGRDYAGADFALPRMTVDGEITGDATAGWMDGVLIWKVPFGWNNIQTTNGAMPIGRFAENSRQIFSITSNGDFSVSKLGNSVERKANGEVYCNGERVE